MYVSYIPIVPLQTIHDSRPKWTKSIPVFTPKRHKNPTHWGSKVLYGFHKGVSPSLPPLPPPPPQE